MSKKGVIVSTLLILIIGTIAGLGGAVAVGTFDNGTSTANAEELSIDEASGPQIPQLTKDEESKAKEIVLSDLKIQEMIKGKEYAVAPEEFGIGVWHTTADKGLEKIGAVVMICFEQTCQIESDWPRLEYDEAKYGKPYYQKTTVHESSSAGSLIVAVNFEEGKVVQVLPLSQTHSDMVSMWKTNEGEGR